MRRLVALLCVALPVVLAGCPETGLRRLNFGRTAIVTGDFDTVEQLIQEVANTQVVAAEIQLFDGYVDGPHFETDLPGGDTRPNQQVEDLLRADTTAGLDQFKTAFFSCGMRGVADHEYNGVQEDDHLVVDQTVVQNVRDAVNHGLKLYFSDWTYDLLEAAWPDHIEWLGVDDELDDAQRGLAGPATGEVVDEDLATFMEVPVGTEIELIFNQGGWAVIQSVSDDVRVLVRGDIPYDDPVTGESAVLPNAPLVVSFAAGGGTVVYTAFHNEAQITDDARDVLRFALSQLSQ